MFVPRGANTAVPWDDTLTPYMNEAINTLSKREYDAVIFAGPARTGKTLGLIDGWIVYGIVCDPADMLVVQMTETKAREHSKTRLARTFHHSPEVRKRLSPSRNDNNVHDKMFRDGSFLKIGWPSITVFSSSDYKRVALTDYDRFPEDIDGEGDGFSLASKRTTTFMSAGMTLAESSPGREITDVKWRRSSPHEAPPTTGILSLYNRGDRRRWYWPCPHCGDWFQPAMENMVGYRDNPDLMAASEAARIQCPHCLALIQPEQKRGLNNRGVWLKEGQFINKDGEISGEARRSRIASFWMEGPAAAYQTWQQLVYKLLTAEEEYERTGSEETLKAVINTDWGLPYLPRISLDQRKAETLIARAEKLPPRRVGDVHDNLGWIERAWNAVGDAAKWAWDRMLDIGREDTLDEKIATLQEKIARARKTPWTVSSSQTEYDQQQLNELQEQKRQKDLLDAKAQAERNYQETQKRRNEQNAALNRDNETESLRHQREVARITAMQYADAAVRNAALERENERHKKAMAQQAKKPAAYHNDEGRRLLLKYSQQQAQVEGQIAAAKLSTTGKMTEAHKQLLSFQQRIADLSGKKLTADEQSVLAHKDEIALALQKLDISQQDLQHQNALNELKKKTLTLTSQLADEESRVRQQHAMALATMGMGDQQRGRYEERLKIQQHYQEQLEQLKRDSKAKGTYGSDEYRQAEQALKGSLNRRLAEWADYNAKVDAAQGDWTLGASRALDNFLAQGGNVAGMTENVFTNAFNGMADSIANFAVTGKGSFRSLTVSILADLAKMEARIAASKLLGSVLAMFGFGTSAGGSTPSGAYSSAALSVIPNADGGVYRSAGLSQYSGSIVNRPTFFAFAKGAGVMGEAGPEAILPLRRGADGKLGVVAAGSGGMAMFAPEYNIEIHNDAGNGQIGPQALQAVYNIGKKAAIDFWQQQSRDGGIAGGGR
ncbi:phage tail tape measure protein [Salmonella enterica]|nr:phage tail tape measure protein [Salmonella enterica]EDX4410882.1 phage tail tape measure protein [Salmonella enterica subsp. houtenae serovar 44:z36,[z38]:-]ECT9808060.1 phage tail tape measure protein [Salmonella enterica]EDT0820116.1 phage tail tape measure protein [Salmonella enterica]EEB1684099.1 phage tail tape measure protein [Salmonella enterica]